MPNEELKIMCLKYKIEQLKKQLKKLEDKQVLTTDERITITGLNNRIKNYEISVSILETSDLLKDDEIALINREKQLEGRYDIYSVTDQLRLGYITFYPEDFDTEKGSVGYSISMPHRGHNYAFKSLKLLSNYLSSEGIEKISVFAEKANEVSVRIIDKFSEEVSYEDKSNDSFKKYIFSINNK